MIVTIARPARMGIGDTGSRAIRVFTNDVLPQMVFDSYQKGREAQAMYVVKNV